MRPDNLAGYACSAGNAVLAEGGNNFRILSSWFASPW